MKPLFPELPDLSSYKKQIISSGINYPLQLVTVPEKGLLAKLPYISSKRSAWPWNQEVNPAVYDKKQNWPVITIVIPSFNQGLFIEEAIRSVLLQNYPNLELIVIDGGSSDLTKEILSKYSPWISYWHSKPDKGQGNAINLGFSIASGEYFGWLNSDDFYNKFAFFHLAKAILKYNKQFYYGDALTADEKGNSQGYSSANLVLDRYLKFGGLIASHSSFWHKDVHQPIWEKLNCSIDLELWIRLVKNSKRRHIHFPLGTFRLQPASKSISKDWKQKWQDDDDLIEAVHGRHNFKKKWLVREYRIIQKLYKLISKFYYPYS